MVVGVVTTYANFVTGAFSARAFYDFFPSTSISAHTCPLCLCPATFTVIKRNDVHSPADAGRIMYGRFGAEFLGVCFWLLHVCVAGSG